MVDGPIRKVEQRMAVQRRWLRFTDHRTDCIAPPASRFSPQFNVPSGQSLDDSKTYQSLNCPSPVHPGLAELGQAC